MFKTLRTFLLFLCVFNNAYSSMATLEQEQAFAGRLGISLEELRAMQEEAPAHAYMDDGWSDGEGNIEGAESRQITQEDWEEALTFTPSLQVLPEPFQAIQLLKPNSMEDHDLEAARAINLEMIDGLAEHLGASAIQINAAREKLELFLQEHKKAVTAAGAA